MCLCNQKYIWDLDEKNIIDYGSWEKCDHCKKHHELYLNYNSESSFSSWADMMEKDLKWNKQQDLDDENQKTTHNIEFKKKKHFAAMVHYFWNVAKTEMGVDEKSNLFKI